MVRISSRVRTRLELIVLSLFRQMFGMKYDLFSIFLYRVLIRLQCQMFTGPASK